MYTTLSRSPRLLACLTLPVLLFACQGSSRTSSHETLATSLASGDRSEEDRARDAGRKPAEVIAFLGIQPGMTVVDLIAASGYYTEVLSAAVGPGGKVYAQNPEFALRIREGANDKALSARLANGRLPNVERVDRPMEDLPIEDGTVDAALTALNFHDIYNARGAEAATRFLGVVYRLLKPGGVLGIIDHAGKAGANNRDVHRIDEQLVEDAAIQAGFEIDGRSDLLRNPDDDRSKGVFTPGLRGQTDRFILRLRKPD